MDIEQLLKLGIEQHASDVHIIPNQPPLYRVEGDLVPRNDLGVLSSDMTKKIIHSMMSDNDQSTFIKNLSVDMGVYYPELGNFRVNAFHQCQGIAAIIRILPEKVPTLDELLMPPIIKRLLMLPYGLILVTGPTGCGKSTTLAAMVDYINTMRTGHILTVEDPIEYMHQSKKGSVNQIQVGRDTLSFSAALRSSLRQDPDIIMLGEMRDLESIRLALIAAESGHLVISTLHSNTAATTISRIIDVFPTSERNRIRNLLSETIQGVLCQTLVKKIPSGRIAVLELMLATPAIRNLIREGTISHIESTLQTSSEYGMFTLEHHLKELLDKGLITQAEISTVSTSRENMKFNNAKKTAE